MNSIINLVLPLFVWKVIPLRYENRYRTSVGTNTFTAEQSVGEGTEIPKISE
jgi:hypothetical protein